MSILADHQIRAVVKQQMDKGEAPLVSPYHQHSVACLPDGQKVTSLGESSYGYDISIFGAIRRMITPQEAVELYGPDHGLVVDPCDFDQRLFKEVEFYEKGEKIVLRPGEFILAVTDEHFNLPRWVSGVSMEKSTLARSNITVTITPLEAGWTGFLTLEIRNNNAFPAHLTVGMGISQVLWFEGKEPCEVSYNDRSGKYQNQPKEPVIPRSLKGLQTLTMDFKAESYESDGARLSKDTIARRVLGQVQTRAAEVPPKPATSQTPGYSFVAGLLQKQTGVSAETIQAMILAADDLRDLTENDLKGYVSGYSVMDLIDEFIQAVPAHYHAWFIHAMVARGKDQECPKLYATGGAHLSVSVDHVYHAIAHGDEQHRKWLREALEAIAANQPIPAPY